MRPPMPTIDRAGVPIRDVAEHATLMGTQPGRGGTGHDVADLVRSPVP